MPAKRSSDKHHWNRRIGYVGEAALLLASLVFLVTTDPRALAGWVVVGTLYVVAGLASVWNVGHLEREDAVELRSAMHWSWISPLLAAATGVASAVLALTQGDTSAHDPLNVLTTVAASLGIILSWILLQVGFAYMYLLLELTDDEDGLKFPGTTQLSVLNYLYFSFTVGTSFAVSDVDVLSMKMRRIVLIHSVFAFFYNALVVAVAFQVLQGAVAS